MMVFLVLYNAKSKQNVRRLFVKPLSIAVFSKTPHARTRKVNSRELTYYKAMEAEINILAKNLVRRKVKSHLKASKYVFQQIHIPEGKNVREKDVQIHENGVLTSPKVMTVKVFNSSVVFKKPFVAKSRIKWMGITPKRPKEFFSKKNIAKNSKGKTIKEQGTLPAKTVGLSKPIYPRYSRLRGEEGNVVVSVDISASGKIGEVEVVSSSGYSRLDRAAIIALSGVKFIPARLNGKSIPSKKEIAFIFKLENE